MEYDVLLSYYRDDSEGEEVVKNVVDLLRSNGKKSRDHPLPVCRMVQQHASHDVQPHMQGKETGQLLFTYWLVVVTKKLLDSWTVLMSLHKMLALLKKQRMVSDCRILPLIVGDRKVCDRFRSILPALSNYRPRLLTEICDKTAWAGLLVEEILCTMDIMDKQQATNLGRVPDAHAHQPIFSIVASDLELSKMEEEGLDVLWNSEIETTTINTNEGSLGVSLAIVEEFTGQKKYVYVCRKLEGHSTNSLQQGDRIVQFGGEDLTADQIVKRLEENEQQYVTLSIQKAKAQFGKDLKQYRRLLTALTSHSYLDQDIRWHALKGIRTAGTRQLGSSDALRCSALNKLSKLKFLDPERHEELRGSKAKYLHFVSDTADEAISRARSDSFRVLDPCCPAVKRTRELYKKNKELLLAEKPTEVDVLGLLEEGSADGSCLEKEHYKWLHTFSLRFPDLFWRKVAGWDSKTGWPQFESAARESNCRHLVFKHPPNGSTCDTLGKFLFDESGEAEPVKFMKAVKTNMCYNLVDRHMKNPHLRQRNALIFANETVERRLTYENLFEEVSLYAHLLRRDAHVKVGQRVLVFMPVCIERIIAMLACFRLGAPVGVMYSELYDRMSDQQRNKDMCKLLAQAECEVVITASEKANDKMQFVIDYICRRLSDINERSDRSANVHLKSIVAVQFDSHPEGDSKLNPLLQDARYVETVCVINPKDRAPADVHPDQTLEWVDAEHPLLYVNTSGSSSDPKTIDHCTGGYMLYCKTSFRYMLDFNVGTKDIEGRDTDVCLATADLGWIYGLSIGLCAPLLNGGTTVQIEISDFDTVKLIDAVKRYGVTHLCTVPMHTVKFARVAVCHDLSSLKVISSSGSPLTDKALDDLKKFQEQTNVRVTDIWWQTETGCFMMGTPSKIKTRHHRRILPFYGVAADVEVDDLLQEDPENPGRKQGELVITQPWPSCYRKVRPSYRNPSVSLTWGFHTGDNAMRNDDDGTFQLLGRKDNRIIMSFPREQKFFMTHSEVLTEICELFYKKQNSRQEIIDMFAVVEIYGGSELHILCEDNAGKPVFLKGVHEYVRKLLIGSAGLPDYIGLDVSNTLGEIERTMTRKPDRKTTRIRFSVNQHITVVS